MNAFMWAVAAASVWGVVPLLEKTGLARVSPLAGLFYRCLGVVIGLVFLGIFVIKPQEIRSVDGRSAAFLIASGFLASFLAQIFFYKGLKLGNVSTVVPISGSYPFISFILGVMLLGEGFSLGKLAGVILVVAGLWVLRIG